MFEVTPDLDRYASSYVGKVGWFRVWEAKLQKYV